MGEEEERRERWGREEGREVGEVGGKPHQVLSVEGIGLETEEPLDYALPFTSPVEEEQQGD